MGKITVKHYLNTNLKPYIINGDRYFSIYALVTANRQNTKVKSKAFNEYYTESDFKEITNPENKEDFEIIEKESITIAKIANLLIEELNDFDTSLFAAIYNYYQSIFILELGLDSFENRRAGSSMIINLYEKDKNKTGIDIDSFFIESFSLKENQSKGMSLFTWFSPVAQNELERFLTENNCLYDIKRTIEILNKIVFYKSFEKLNWIFKGSRKFEGLTEKYSNIFELPDEYSKPFYQELSV